MHAGNHEPQKPTGMNQIREGVLRFRTAVFPKMRELYERLAEKQKPHTLFLTCGDSRIEPSLLTGTEPGQIFVERTPGNIVPVYHDTVAVGVSASIEYAVAVLHVSTLIVCGHSTCGAMKALLDPKGLDGLPATARWLEYAQPALDLLNRNYSPIDEGDRLRRLSQLNVVAQIAHLYSHPVVAQQFNSGTLSIYGWFYEIHTGTVLVFNPAKGEFEEWPLADQAYPSITSADAENLHSGEQASSRVPPRTAAAGS